jgi:hypothetical protein
MSWGGEVKVKIVALFTEYIVYENIYFPYWEAANCAATQEFPSIFKEPEGLCSQEPHTGPYPEPVRSSPHHPILYLLRFILILSSHLRLGSG